MDEYQVESEAEDNYDAAVEYQDSMQDQVDASFPQQKEQHNQFAWFWKVVQRKDSTKVANLDKHELGTFLMPVREAKRFGNLCGMFDQKDLHSFFVQEAENTLATSMSKKGWFVETSISQKKFTSRSRDNGLLQQQSQGGSKWKLFSKPKPVDSEPAAG